jgi:hypothetical protein
MEKLYFATVKFKKAVPVKNRGMLDEYHKFVLAKTEIEACDLTKDHIESLGIEVKEVFVRFALNQCARSYPYPHRIIGYQYA